MWHFFVTIMHVIIIIIVVAVIIAINVISSSRSKIIVAPLSMYDYVHL